MGIGPGISELMFWEYIAFIDAWAAAHGGEGGKGPVIAAPPREDALAWFNSDG